jgi:peptidoglycan/LPS O-acetylase OafA/YrhL
MIKKLNILESVRGGAALYVFFGHFILRYFIDKTNPISILFAFGQEAVILFFLMSGFVIQYSYRQKKITFSNYFKKRFFRIYPLFLVAILLVFIHNIISGFTIDIKTLLGNLLMLQDVESLKPGTIVDTYGNSALWSLSYEWWFYMLFIPVSNFKNKNRFASLLIIFSAVLYFIFPIQLLRWLIYFSIWWSGVLLADFYVLNQLNLKTIFNKIIVQILLFPTLVLLLKAISTPFVSVGVYPVLEIRHFLSAIVFIMIAFFWKKMHWSGYVYFKPLEKVAPFSYGLYVLHLPIIMIIEPLVFGQIEYSMIQFVLITLIVILMAYLFEIKIQKRFISQFPRVN